MDAINTFILEHAHNAHWFIFGAILLAGLNIPLSIDLLVLASALLAATIAPEKMWTLYITITLGCYLSAWISYWVGRLLGRVLLRFRFFKKLLSEERLQRVKIFYEKH